MTVTASIQARLRSSRLPGKVLYELGNRRVIEHVVNRCEDAETIDTVVVTTGHRDENDAIREWARRNDIRCMTGSEDELLERHLAVATETNCEKLVRITGDCPFLPSGEIDRLVRRHIDADYTTNFTNQMPIGTDIDVLPPETLQQLYNQGEDHPVLALRTSPENWNVVITENKQLLQYSTVDLALDTPADYWLLTDAVAAVGTDPYDVVEWLAEHE